MYGESKHGHGILNGIADHSGTQTDVETSYWMKNKPKPKKYADKQVVSLVIEATQMIFVFRRRGRLFILCAFICYVYVVNMYSSLFCWLFCVFILSDFVFLVGRS